MCHEAWDTFPGTEGQGRSVWPVCTSILVTGSASAGEEWLSLKDEDGKAAFSVSSFQLPWCLFIATGK